MISPFKTVINGIELEFVPISLVGKNYQVYYMQDDTQQRFHISRDTDNGEYKIALPENCPQQIVDSEAEISSVVYAQQREK